MMEPPLFAGHIAAPNRLYFPASLAAQWGHMTTFWPMGWKQRTGWQHLLKMATMGLPFLPLLQLPAGWKVEILAEAPEPWTEW